MEKGLELIHRRRSIRRYTTQPVGQEQVEALLRAAMAAPSASNRQPWQFVAVSDRTTLDKLSEVHQYAKMLKEATLCIAVCGDRNNKFWEQDCAAATQNILLAATALSIGAVWLGIHPNPEPTRKVVELLQIAETHLPLCLIAVGQPAEQKEPVDRYDADKVHWEKW
jgi:nitroreductase